MTKTTRPARYIAGLLLCCAFTGVLSQDLHPLYKRASYGNASATLRNDGVQFNLFKRIDGWGWGELHDRAGRLMAVLDHLGEVMLSGQDIPVRLTADTFRRRTGAREDSLLFSVRAVVVRDKLKGTSFEQWMSYPFSEPCLTGEVIITLKHDQPVIQLHYRLHATGNYDVLYVRGPWLKVGEGSFGASKDDAIFPGIEWTVGDEWSSGTNWFKDPWALRDVPHPYQVAIPLMALSYGGTGIGMAWNPTQTVTRWFNYRDQQPQPVFAAPNFIDRMNNNLMGLMIPDARTGNQNEVVAAHPLQLRIGEPVDFDAEIWLSEGRSLDVITDWVKRHGLPKSKPEWPYKNTLDSIANAYNTHFWHEGEGFGIKQKSDDHIRPGIPEFLKRYIRENKGTTLAKALEKKIAWCVEQTRDRSKNQQPEVTRAQKTDELLAIQKPDGSFYFDPDGRHKGKDDFKVATSFIEPMGLAFETALDMGMTPCLQLLQAAKAETGKKYRGAAKKTLDFYLNCTRPEGGDFWETPLHAPNLLAAGHAAIAYYEGYLLFGDEQYRRKAIYWIRSVIPFTNLWEPEDVKNLYNTKPCFCASDWYFANWVRDHVQWEVLSVFAQSAAQGIDWSKVDKEIDWKTFHRGITDAAIRWMNKGAEDNWRPHNIPSTLDAYRRGDYNYCFPDTHNSITGNYGGMFIMPEPIAANIYAILDNER